MEEKTMETICKEIDKLVQQYGYTAVKTIELIADSGYMTYTKHERVFN